jgi:hypothetical protein
MMSDAAVAAEAEAETNIVFGDHVSICFDSTDICVHQREIIGGLENTVVFVNDGVCHRTSLRPKSVILSPYYELGRSLQAICCISAVVVSRLRGDRHREMDQSTRLPDRLMAKMQAGLEARRVHLEEIVAELNEPALGDHD